MDRATVEFHRWVSRETANGRSRSHACPTCKRDGVLSDFEAGRGYQCGDCTARTEGMHDGP